jgi:hypothetical protein
MILSVQIDIIYVQFLLMLQTFISFYTEIIFHHHHYSHHHHKQHEWISGYNVVCRFIFFWRLWYILLYVSYPISSFIIRISVVFQIILVISFDNFITDCLIAILPFLLSLINCKHNTSGRISRYETVYLNVTCFHIIHI